MAKGRKLTGSRSERLLGSFSYNQGNHENVSNGSEFREDDVWASFDRANNEDHAGNGSVSEWNSSAASESNGSLNSYRSRRHLPRVDQRRQVGGLSLAFDDSDGTAASSRIVHQYRAQERAASSPRGARHVAASAPVNVPDWSKIYRINSVESLPDPGDDNEDDGDLEWLPPHEYLAREYARSGRTTSNSVFEGVGRTLKGRDMSRVRDAVWSQTGYDG